MAIPPFTELTRLSVLAGLLGIGCRHGTNPFGAFARRRLCALVLEPHLLKHMGALFGVGQTEGLPPLSQRRIDLLASRSQAHEIKRRTETGLLQEPQGRVAQAFFKPWLHAPDLAHVRPQFAPPRDLTDARVKDLVNGILQGRKKRLTLIHASSPGIPHIAPEHTCEQVTGHHRLHFLYPAIGVEQGLVHQGIV